jgi:hypothetical protein
MDRHHIGYLLKINAHTFVIDNIIIFNKNILIFRSILLSKNVPENNTHFDQTQNRIARLSHLFW